MAFRQLGFATDLYQRHPQKQSINIVIFPVGMQRFSLTATILTTLLSVPLTVLCIYFNLNPATAGAAYIILTMAVYLCNRHIITLIVSGTINFILMLSVPVIGLVVYGEAFQLTSWVAEVAAFLSVAALLYFYGKHVKDLDERKTSEERLELALEGMTAGHWDWNVKENKRWWSDRHFELLGYRPGEIRPSDETLRSIIHPDDVGAAYTVMDEYLHRQSKFEMEIRYKTKSGAYKWFLATGQSKFDEMGQPVRMVGSIIDIDEKKRGQQIIASQAALINALPHAVAFGTKPQNVVSLNRAAEKLFGVASSDAAGKSIDDLVKIEVLGATRDEVRNSLWGGRGFWQGESVFTTAEGKKTVVLVTLRTIKDTAGIENGWMGIYTDITPLKLIEERLETALEGMSAGLWEWDIVKDKRWWSPRYYEMLGFSEDELTPSGETLRSLMHPDDLHVLGDILGAYSKRAGKFEKEMRYRTKWGHYRWFKVQGQTVTDAAGVPLRMVGTLLDVHEKHKSKKLIEQQAELINMMPDGIVYCLQDRTVLRLNEGAEKTLGVKAGEIVGRNLDDFVKVFPIGNNVKDVRTELWKNGFWRGEVETINNTGEKRLILANIKIVDELDGDKPGWVGIYTDISLLRLNEELKSVLARLEINNLYLEQFAYISSHDIKSPIIALEGLVDMLVESNAVKGEYARVLQLIRNTVAQMQRTNNALNNILRLRKNLVDDQQAGEEALPLKNILADVQETLRTNFDDAHALLHLDIEAVQHVRFPHVHLKSVFYNLISNALKYRDYNRPLVVNVTAQNDDNGMYVFTVDDNGLGIDLERHRDKLFGIFKRFHVHVDGAGVGLHIVKSIVEAYGGTIIVESTPGKGTCFEFTFKGGIIA